MTTINISGLVQVLGIPGQEPIGSGEIVSTPWAGSEAAVRFDGPDIIVPDALVTQIIDGVPAPPLDLEPNDTTWCWRITVIVPEVRFSHTGYYSVPNLAAIDFGALVEVDPYTFVPNSNTVNAWSSAVTSPSRSILTIEAMTEAQFEASTPSPTQLTFIIPE
jgi:hypothetical protein